MRVLVRVSPVEVEARGHDEMPAEVMVDFSSRLAALGVRALPDLATLQVVRYDPVSGATVPFAGNQYATMPGDRPFRWYDDAVPYEFPDFQRDLAQTKGEFRTVARPRWGYFYEVIGDWRKGRLAWVHTQDGSHPSCYAVYFDLLAEGQEPHVSPQRGWVGDGGNRCEATGNSSTGQFHTRLALDDWDDDGLIDIIVGCHRGQMLWYPNTGTRTAPRFNYGKMVFKSDGTPLDIGLHGSPCVADFNGDGAKDLLISALWDGHVNYFENRGTNGRRKLVHRGFVEADGQPIENPFTPVPEAEGPKGEPVFKRDYFGQLQVIDWDGDGDIDLLNGGYVTGRVYWYENTGSRPDGTPDLTFRGTLEADGQPLDVGWAAAPSAVDLDADGDLDLLSGSWPKQGRGGKLFTQRDAFLRYFENVGSRDEPKLTEKPLPHDGEFPLARLAVPGLADWDDDGDLDLIVSSRMDMYLFENTGTASAPRFAAHVEPLRMPWGNAYLLSGVFGDWNNDGFADIAVNDSICFNTGKGYPWTFSKRQSLLAPGERIDHPVQQGDGWRFARPCDFDCDGRVDVLFADFHGFIWFHRNRSDAETRRFDLEGAKVCTNNGRPIRVGPEADANWNFTVLQGARPRFAAADFNNDGKPDLAVRDTLGSIVYFQHVRDTDEPCVDEPVLLAERAGRGFVTDVDWNGDGWRDLLAPSSAGNDILFLNAAGKGPDVFHEPQPFERPAIPVRGVVTNVHPVDLNRDGDDDLVVSNSYLFTCFFERSFLNHGYATGHIVAIEKRPGE